MKAAVISRPGGPDVLEYREVPTPEPEEGQVLVAVKAAGVNRMDVLQRMGNYPVPAGYPADIPGVEFAGTVAKAGPGVSEFAPGQPVFGLTGGGAYAQFVLIDRATLLPLPEHLDFTEAATIPEAFITAYDAMVLQAGLSAGDTVLISAVGSGVGTAGVQIARVFGANCIGTARSRSKLQSAEELGLNTGIEAEDGKFSAQVLEATQGRGVDVVMELVGGNYIVEDLKCLAEKGRITVVGLLGGSKVELNLGMLMQKRATIRGTVLRARPLEEKILVTKHFREDVLPHFASGKLKAVADKVFPLQQAAEAHKYMESGNNFGKVVLQVEQE